MRRQGIVGLLAMMLVAGRLDGDTDEVASFDLLAEPPLLSSAVPGQMLVFLVTIESDSADPVRLTAVAQGADVTVFVIIAVAGLATVFIVGEFTLPH